MCFNLHVCMYDICKFFVSFCSVSTNVPHQTCCSSIWDAQFLQCYFSVCFVSEWMLSTSLWLILLQCQGGFQLPWRVTTWRPQRQRISEDGGDHQGDDEGHHGPERSTSSESAPKRWNVPHKAENRLKSLEAALVRNEGKEGSEIVECWPVKYK